MGFEFEEEDENRFENKRDRKREFVFVVSEGKSLEGGRINWRAVFELSTRGSNKYGKVCVCTIRNNETLHWMLLKIAAKSDTVAKCTC